MTGLPQRQGSQDFGTMLSQLAVGQESIQFIPLHPSTGQRNRFQFGVPYKHFQQHMYARGARVWVEVRDRLELRSGCVVDLRVVDLLVVDCQA